MNTVVNNPPPAADSGSGAWMVVGIVIGIIIVLLLLYYGVPALRNANPSTDGDTGGNINVDITLPEGSGAEGGANQ